MNPTLQVQLMVSKPTHLAFTVDVIFTNVSLLPTSPSSLILLCSPGSPERPARKRVRLLEPPHTPSKTQAIPPETQCMFVYLSL